MYEPAGPEKYEGSRLEAPDLNLLPHRDRSGKVVRRAGFLRSFGFAFEGLVYVVRTQRNMRVHLALGTVAVLLAVWLGLTAVEWALLLLTIGGIFALEMINTVVEALVDMITEEFHPLAKIAKDAAAGAVLVGAIFAVGVGLFLFGPRLLHDILHLI